MTSTQVLSFETWPAEIRNRVYKYLTEEARLYFSGTQVLRQVIRYTPAGAILQLRPFNIINADPKEFHFQLASTCTQLRTEHLPILLENTMLYINGCVSKDVLPRLPPAYRTAIRQVATRGLASLGFDADTFAMLPALESIEYITEPLDWVPRTKAELAWHMSGMGNGYGLIEGHRNWLYTNHDDQDFLFLLAGGIPTNIKVTVAHCVRIRLPSKHTMLAIRGVGAVPERDDQEVAVVSLASFPASSQLVLTLQQEVRYDWRCGKLLGGIKELLNAWEYVSGCFDQDVETDRKLQRLGTARDMDEGERDDLEREVESWNNREGYCYVAEGREWAWKGVVKEMDY